MSKVATIYAAMEQNLDTDSKMLSGLRQSLVSIVSRTESEASRLADQGYAFKFTLRSTNVRNLFPLLKLNTVAVAQAFQADWGYPSNAKMYDDPYYHVLLLVLRYGLRRKDQSLAEHSLLLILVKVWNGRKAKYLRYCDSRVMLYVTENMLNRKFLASKFDTPYSMLKGHFVPTILKTYGNRVIGNSGSLKKVFQETWKRINQMFVHNLRINMATGKKEAQGGLLPLYMKAKQEGLMISVTAPKEYDAALYVRPAEDHVERRRRFADAVVKYIGKKGHSGYPEDFLNMVSREVGLTPLEVLETLMLLHRPEDHEVIGSIIECTLALLSLRETEEEMFRQLLVPGMLDTVKEKVINASDPHDRKRLNDLIEMIMPMAKRRKPQEERTPHEKLHKPKRRALVIYGIYRNIREYIFSKGTTPVLPLQFIRG